MAAGMVSRVAVVFALKARADAIERRRSPELVQAHSRRLPSETEQAEAAYAARQLRAAADDLMAGFEE